MGSHPSFIGRRISVQGLVDWIEAGRSWEGFAETFRIEPDAVKEAFRYLNNDPPYGNRRFNRLPRGVYRL